MKTELVPTMIRGVLYPSIAEAARQLGIKRKMIDAALSRGNTDGVGLGRGWHNKRPMIVDGVLYDKQYLAGASMGLCPADASHLYSRAKKAGGRFVYKGHVVEIPE